MYNVAIVGATGAVGRMLVEVLDEREFPVAALRLLASERSVGESVEFKGQTLPVEVLSRESFAEIDIALFCAGSAISESYCPVSAAAGALCIDNSGFWSLVPDVPLIVPEVNGDALVGYQKKRIVASPASATVEVVLPLQAIARHSRLLRVVAATYHSVSEDGKLAVEELRVQSGERLNGRALTTKCYPHPIAFNCLPQVGALLDSGDSSVEMQIVNEVRKILQLPALRMTVSAVTVPVFYGGCAALNIETEDKVSAHTARQLFEDSVGIDVMDDPGQQRYPLVSEAVGQDTVCIGRIREDHSLEHGLNLWVAADNQRKGAATNMVQIAELLHLERR